MFVCLRAIQSLKCLRSSSQGAILYGVGVAWRKWNGDHFIRYNTVNTQQIYAAVSTPLSHCHGDVAIDSQRPRATHYLHTTTAGTRRSWEDGWWCGWYGWPLKRAAVSCAITLRLMRMRFAGVACKKPTMFSDLLPVFRRTCRIWWS